jgi:hypothetical protein
MNLETENHVDARADKASAGLFPMGPPDVGKNSDPC